MAINWTCPFCDRPQTATAEKYSQTTSVFKNMEASDGRFALNCIALVCSNVECGRTTIDAELSHPTSDPLSGYLGAGRALKKWRLQPQGTARPLPEYIPVPIREDYYEACLIRDSSPKAAATLIRRAMQGMIRDFCGISKPTLLAEISELKKLVEEDRAPRGVSAESVDAIDHVRGLGNIGAHMEKDISIVVDVDPGEALLQNSPREGFTW